RAWSERGGAGPRTTLRSTAGQKPGRPVGPGLPCAFRGLSTGGSDMTVDVVSESQLKNFGYRPELRRRVGTYASFAAGFSFVSILTTVFQLFGLGYGLGGASFFWTWPGVWVGQMMG